MWKKVSKTSPSPVVKSIYFESPRLSENVQRLQHSGFLPCCFETFLWAINCAWTRSKLSEITWLAQEIDGRHERAEDALGGLSTKCLALFYFKMPYKGEHGWTVNSIHLNSPNKKKPRTQIYCTTLMHSQKLRKYEQVKMILIVTSNFKLFCQNTALGFLIAFLKNSRQQSCKRDVWKFN